MEEFLGNALLAAGTFLVGLFVTKMLIDVTIALIEVTVDSIKRALMYRSEIRNNNVMKVIVKEIIREDNCMVVSLNAFNANNENVGKIKLSGKSAGVHVGQQIAVA